MTSHDAPLITPDTKLGPLLAQLPELEPVLMALSPKFAKLKNPVLRRTVARVATLNQVARVGGIPVADLIRELRTAAGQPEWSGSVNQASTGTVITGEPARRLDIRPDIESGGHPMETVLAALHTLAPGDILEIIAPFEPAPLLDIIGKQGMKGQVTEREPDFVVIWIQKTADETGDPTGV